MGVKKINVKSFTVEQIDNNTQTYNFQQLLENKLSGTVEDRYQEINQQDENHEGYVITSYVKDRNTLFGIFAKLMPEKSIHITENEFQKNQVSLNELTAHSVKNQKGLIKEYFYFCIYNNKLLINCGRNVKPFQTYCNYLIGHENLFQFRPKLINNPEIALDNIKNIVIGETYLLNSANAEASTNTSNISIKKNLAKYLKLFQEELFNDISDEEIDAQDIIYAKILLKFKTKRGKKKDENNNYQNALKSLIKAGATDDFVIKTKNNKTIKGTEVEESFVIEADVTTSLLPNEETIKQDMIAYITR